MPVIAGVSELKPGQVVNRDFSWSETDEPHASRRKLILAKHPEIVQLFGPEPLTFWVVLGLVSIQFAIALFLVPHIGFGYTLLLSYVVGGTINHTLQLAVHDISHNLAFKTPVYNKLLGIFANFPTGIPSSVTFQRYHMDHHQFQGVDQLDVDVPSQAEIDIFTNSFRKLVWVILQPLFYALRPLICRPKAITNWEIANAVAQITVDALVVYFFGLPSLGYLIIGSVLGTGLHPSAGHFIAEHYEYVKGQETYSYYGPMNFFNLNVGYHNEHHDFPKVAWTKLPQVKAMAPEFYDNLPCYTSYLYVFYRYIVDPTIGPFSRVKRSTRFADGKKTH